MYFCVLLHTDTSTHTHIHTNLAHSSCSIRFSFLHGLWTHAHRAYNIRAKYFEKRNNNYICVVSWMHIALCDSNIGGFSKQTLSDALYHCVAFEHWLVCMRCRPIYRFSVLIVLRALTLYSLVSRFQLPLALSALGIFMWLDIGYGFYQ